MGAQQEIQLGKHGLTTSFLEGIKKRFSVVGVTSIKIRVLKSSREKKEDVKEYAQKIQSYLGDKFTYRVLGFSIFLKKWRKVPVQKDKALLS
jgi:RNA-binding protein YhbY